MTKKIKHADINEFMISEFSALQDRAMNYEDVKSSRVNFLLLITGAIIAGVTSIADTHLFKEYWALFIGIAGLIILFLGIATLNHSIDYSIAITLLFRKAARIRRWFFEQDRTTGQYLPFQSYDDQPKIGTGFLVFRGGEAAIQIVNTVSIVSMFVSILISLKINTFFLLLLTIIVIVLSWIIQNYYIRKRLKRGEKMVMKSIRFPTPEKDSKSNKHAE